VIQLKFLVERSASVASGKCMKIQTLTLSLGPMTFAQEIQPHGR